MRKNTVWAALLLAAPLMLVACGGGGGEETAVPAPASTDEKAAGPATDMASAGSIAGMALYEGEDTDTVIKMNADPNCAAANEGDVYTETVVAEGGKLANVFVYVKNAPAGGAAPTETVVLNQEGCTYYPHVFGVQTGQEFIVRNSDQSLHNIHATPATNEGFNQSQPFEGMEMTKSFDKGEIMVPFKCDVHPWMSAYIGVVDHPYFAVTGADGSFTIDGIPAGTYTVEAWHETFGTRTAEVTVEADGAAGATFDFNS